MTNPATIRNPSRSLDLEGYLSWLDSHEKTTRTPRNSLHVFEEYLATNDIGQAEALTVSGITAYASSLKSRGLSHRTRATYLAAVAGYHRYAVRTGKISQTAQELEQVREELSELLGDIGRRIAREPLHKRLPPAAAIEGALQEARTYHPTDDANLDLDQRRDKALILVLATTGARVSEIAGLKRGDLDAETMSATVRGKGGKTRRVYLSPEAWEATRDYLEKRCDEYSRRPTDLQPVFSTKTGEKQSIAPISPRQIQRIVRDVATRAGISFHLTPHTFRHWVATKFLETSSDLAATQDLLGHSDPKTTRIYASVSSERIRELHREAFREKQDA